MDTVPDEIWTRIFEIGIEQNILSYRDLSSIAISSRRLCRLSGQNGVWKLLWAKDFPSEADSAAFHQKYKSIYRLKFERIKAVKVAAHKRSVLRIQSQALVLERECKDLETQLQEEKKRHNSTLVEFKNLERARQSSIALNVWQPQFVRLAQNSVLEHTPVHTESRIHSLKMEMRVCKERIARFTRSINEKQNMMERVKRELEALTYKPLKESYDASTKICFEVQRKKRKIMEQKDKDASNRTYMPYEIDMTFYKK